MQLLLLYLVNTSVSYGTCQQLLTSKLYREAQTTPKCRCPDRVSPSLQYRPLKLQTTSITHMAGRHARIHKGSYD